ncbi:MAG TPA: hypothetical protein VF017_07725 [Thermoanaerobaculia bacterium]|nr:hypothetical protein [Thermoanaerobaculia bacterium]
MSPRTRLVLALLALALPLATLPARAGEHSIGVGIHYWRTVDGLPSGSTFDDIEDDGNSYVLSYQYQPRGIFTFQVDAELYQDGYGGSTERTILPEVFVLVGGNFYAGAGAGVAYSDGLEDSPSDPFYMGRLGYRLTLLGSIELDVHATYRFDEWDELENIDVDTDTYTFGAVLRVGL